ncbi:MAG: rod shape-determining protein [Patescibacteria group bacterium]|nr:rod shape-determining protein [Patescibacteria group bacterium]MDE2589301.1 rod shape-determining protein [Patescibacteria group bacterium]
MIGLINNFFGMFSKDIGIDLGTANTLIWVRGKGVVIREPSVVARHKKTKQVIAIGTEAKKMLGKTPASIETVRPLRGGVIADFDATAAMIAHYMREVNQTSSALTKSFIHPRVAVGIPSAVTEVERRAVWEAALSGGAREAYLIEEPMAAAIGAGVSVFQPTGIMVVDVGGGTTEIAVISLGGIVVNRSLKLAGDDMNEAIVHYIRLRHGLLIGEKTAEEVKISIGSAYEARHHRGKAKSSVNAEEKEEVTEKMAIVRGRDIEAGLPKSLRINEVEIREALAPVLAEIIEGIAEVAEEAPPELTSDILEHGILLTGGGALLPGFDRLIVERTHIPVVVAEDPLTTVVRGTGKVLEDANLLNRVKVTGGLK